MKYAEITILILPLLSTSATSWNHWFFAQTIFRQVWILLRAEWHEQGARRPPKIDCPLRCGCDSPPSYNNFRYFIIVFNSHIIPFRAPRMYLPTINSLYSHTCMRSFAHLQTAISVAKHSALDSAKQYFRYCNHFRFGFGLCVGMQLESMGSLASFVFLRLWWLERFARAII